MPLRARWLLPALCCLTALSLADTAPAPPAPAWRAGVLTVPAADGALRITPHTPAAIEVEWIPGGESPRPSFAIAAPAVPVAARLRQQDGSLLLDTGALEIVVQTPGPQVVFRRRGEVLLSGAPGFFRHDLLRGVRFRLRDGEQLIGGGERVLGMDRRGHRLPLYNKPAYGYGAHEPVEQMYYSLPAVLSNRNYLLLWDNPARGELDIGASDETVLQFQSVAGRMAYLLVAGEDFPDTLRHYTAVTGRQPMPPRWALGSYASRFGYRSRAQVEDVVRRYREQRIPLDALVLDIFWFGADIRGHMGNLAWDREHFPDPEGMLRALRADGVHPVMVTEPFILRGSRRWQEAVDAGVLARNPGGDVKRFDFYFGNTGLLDVFDPAARAWLWARYRELIGQGLDGIWGDLGEPEVHPTDTLHRGGSADALHNAYGHRWAQLVYENHRRDYPGRRPMILMRAGFAGSQRYGMIPWTGDVLRDWSGLQPQVELSLQMGLLGLAYVHSDLGGFADGDAFDPELYLRWLQYGVFQPLFRPHGQEHIASEPVFHGEAVAEQARRLLELRYALMPYLYTMAWENARTGMPLARPLFFLEPENGALFSDDRAFLWGPDLLVAPVVQPGVTQKTFYLPRGTWFDFHRGQRIEGGREITVPVSDDAIPLLVRAGALLPMVPPVQRLADYSSERLTIHYYPDASVPRSSRVVYEDDGATPGAHLGDAHELLRFTAQAGSGGGLTIAFERSGGDYAGRPARRRLTLHLHHQPRAPDDVRDRGGKTLPRCVAAGTLDCYRYDPATAQLQVVLDWRGEARRVAIH